MLSLLKRVFHEKVSWDSIIKNINNPIWIDENYDKIVSYYKKKEFETVTFESFFLYF